MKLLITLCAALAWFAQPAFADQKPVSQLNELLKGEIAAVETYRQALEKLGTEPAAEPLRKALQNHRDAVQHFSMKVKELGGTPTSDSGAWGVWAETVVGSAKLLGDEAALKALKEGEEHGIKEYKEVLANKEVPEDIKRTIREDFVPQQEQHIAMIDSIMDKV